MKIMFTGTLIGFEKKVSKKSGNSYLAFNFSDGSMFPTNCMSTNLSLESVSVPFMEYDVVANFVQGKYPHVDIVSLSAR